MQLFDTLPPHIEDALRASIERFGVLVPIVVWRQTGEILDGHHRKRLTDELDVECPVHQVDAEDEAQAREIAATLNLDRRHHSPEKRREIVAHLRGEGHSYRAIGEALGVSHQQAKRDVESAGVTDVTPDRTTGTDGKQYPATRPAKVTERESTSTTYEGPSVTDMAGAFPDFTDGKPAEEFIREQRSEPEPSKLAPMMSSDTPEWYTPADIVQRATKVLDGIDLDPCSNTGTPNVPAEEHFTEADDGLARDWHGTVYMNPPYGRGIDQWASKLVTEHEDGRVTAAVALVPARTDTQWFRIFRDHPVCFLTGRLRFLTSEGETDPAPFPSAAIYLGDREDLFAEVFAQVGDVYVRWEAAA